MPRRNRNVDTARLRTPLEQLPKRVARRINTKAQRRGRQA